MALVGSSLTPRLINKAKRRNMKCAYCKKEITENPILFAGYDFCSDVCQLRFYKEEMPNLGGEFITDEEIKELEQAMDERRDDLYEKISLRNMERFNQSKFMSYLKEKTSPPWIVALRKLFKKFRK